VIATTWSGDENRDARLPRERHNRPGSSLSFLAAAQRPSLSSTANGHGAGVRLSAVLQVVLGGYPMWPATYALVRSSVGELNTSVVGPTSTSSPTRSSPSRKTAVSSDTRTAWNML